MHLGINTLAICRIRICNIVVLGFFFTCLFSITGCEILESPVTRSKFENTPPETYLTISSNSVIYAHLDSVVCDSTGKCDTSYSYYMEADSLPSAGLDTIQNALQTVLASTQTLSWWGEDTDGEVIGYYYKWKHEQDWTYTTNESETFIIPIREKFGIFGFEVKAMDFDSLVDPTPAKITLPVKNSPPVINFRYRSNPIVSNPYVTEKTFPTRTFLWTVNDIDGLETVDSIFYALDDTTNWNALSPKEKGITLTDIDSGKHVFYLKVQDIAGAESEIIHYPDVDDNLTPNTWLVMEPTGDVLLVDDFPFDTKNNAMSWYKSILDTIPEVGSGGYSVWEIGNKLPFSEVDISATLGYFKHIIWYSATTGPETYGDASNSINTFIQKGGNVFFNVTEIISSASVWFPYDSTATVNPNGRLFSGTTIESVMGGTPDLTLSKLIPFRVSSFALNDTSGLDPDLGPYFTPIYRMPEPTSDDPWTGRPIVAAEYDHRSPVNSTAGKAILFTIPFHDGASIGGPTMGGGSGAVGKFIAWMLVQRFQL